MCMLRCGLLPEYCLADASFLLLLHVLQPGASALHSSYNSELDFLDKREQLCKTALQLILHRFHCKLSMTLSSA